MSNTYLTLKRKHQEEVNNFPIVFAFSAKQFEEAMTKLGLTVADTDKIYSIDGGGYIRKTDSETFSEMVERHDKEMKDAINSDLTGEGFIFEMFSYELSNREYGYTGDIEPTLDALGLTVEEIQANNKLRFGLEKARKAARKCVI